MLVLMVFMVLLQQTGPKTIQEKKISSFGKRDQDANFHFLRKRIHILKIIGCHGNHQWTYQIESIVVGCEVSAPIHLSLLSTLITLPSTTPTGCESKTTWDLFTITLFEAIRKTGVTGGKSEQKVVRFSICNDLYLTL